MKGGSSAATMSDVAAAAGVSITTVSHVLNGTRPVNGETVKRVRAAVERVGYRPNRIARALAGARTHMLGLAVGGFTNPYLTDFISAIESEAARHDYTILLVDTHDEAEKELRVVQELALRRVDGILIAPSAQAGVHAIPHLLAESVPIVVFDRFLAAEVDQVGTENEEPTARLVKHLADVGHRRIGLVAGLEGLSTTDERIRGYQQGLTRSGIPVDPGLIVHGESQHEAARGGVHRLLDAGAAPTALVAANNSMTIGVLQALRDRQLRVPDDMALVAFDDFEWSDLFEPRLTVVAQPTREIGTEAVRLLLSRIEDPDRPVTRLRLPAEVVHRESCGCESPQSPLE